LLSKIHFFDLELKKEALSSEAVKSGVRCTNGSLAAAKARSPSTVGTIENDAKSSPLRHIFAASTIIR